ncbi:DNA repair protein RecO [Pelagibacteraceae bacterium]|jgi:DNA repair protein RecO (recombination protein O)|nr:DNA repair protein RecO [Pelagibacteraceae bacterium]|tara:strand:+ start:6669 stop:7349 length:681 start_codon:yes stop_codon:yes gene_type:complete
MNWQDEGFLLSKIKFRENANIVNVFTNIRGKVSGIIYGGASRKIRNFLQISNKIFVIHSSKSENRIGYFKTELVEAISPKYFNDKKKTTALLSLSAILNLLLPESQPYKNLYTSLNNLLNNFENSDWIVNYIYWELTLLKELGFDPFLEQFISDEIQTSRFKSIEIDNIKYQVPIFLLTKKKIDILENKEISTALTFTRNILTNKFFYPNNLSFPKSRIILENYFN